MMPILVKSEDVRSGRKAKLRHGGFQAAQESVNLCCSSPLGLFSVCQVMFVSFSFSCMENNASFSSRTKTDVKCHLTASTTHT